MHYYYCIINYISSISLFVLTLSRFARKRMGDFCDTTGVELGATGDWLRIISGAASVPGSKDVPGTAGFVNSGATSVTRLELSPLALQSEHLFPVKQELLEHPQ